MTWLEEVISSFEVLGGQAHVQEIYRQIESAGNRELPPTWRASVRKTIEHYSSDSKAFLGKLDLFETVNGITNGVWKLRDFELLKANDTAPPSVPDLPTRKKFEYYRIIRDTYMVRKLKRTYNYSCQICNLKLGTEVLPYCEGHHLKPLGSIHKGPDIPENILILCPNHHAEFDLGLVAMDIKSSRLIHFDARNSFHGQRITFKHTITPAYNKYHLNQIFMGNR